MTMISKLNIIICSDSPYTISGYGKQALNLTLGLAELGHHIIFIPANATKMRERRVGVGDGEVPFSYSLSDILQTPGEVSEAGKLAIQMLGELEISPEILANNREDGGIGVMMEYISEKPVDMIIYLKDPWLIKEDVIFPDCFVYWLPIDHEPASSGIIEMAKRCKHVVALCRQGAKELGISKYIYHSVGYTDKDKDKDKDILLIKSQKQDLRTQMSLVGDKFICSMIASNGDTPSRKCIEINLEAFQKFNERCPEAILVLVTNVEGTRFFNRRFGIDVLQAIERLKIKRQNVVIANNNISEDTLQKIYQTSDVLLHASSGEGFGVPIIEAQYFGCPVITTAVTAMPELTLNGVSITDYQNINTSFHMTRAVPNSSAICEAIYSIYKRTDLQTTYLAEAGHRFISDNFSYKKIAAEWIDYYRDNIQDVSVSL